MGFKDLLRKAASVTAKALDNAAKNVEYQKRVKEAKREILSRFTVKQLERIASTKGISLYEEDILTGERTRLRTKGEIVGRLASRLSFNEVVDLARRYKVRYSDVVQELEAYKQELFGEKKERKSDSRIVEEISRFEDESVSSEGEIVLRELLEFVPPRPAKDEKELQGQVAAWLAAKFGVDAVTLEYPFEHGAVDIVVWDSVAIELKVASSKQKLKNLIGEVQTDKMYFGSVIAVIFDIGKDVGLDFYINQLKALGAKVVVVPATIKKSRGRRQEIIIKGKGREIIIR